MVFCRKCGEENEDDRTHCKNCGAPLYSRRRIRRREEDLCFGVPMADYTWGLIIGAVIVLWGISELVGFDFNFWAIFAVAFGLLIVWNALNRPGLR